MADSFAAQLGPVWVVGKGLVTPRGWISPETRELMEKAQRESEEAQAAMKARDDLAAHTTQVSDQAEEAPCGTPDPWGDLR